MISEIKLNASRSIGRLADRSESTSAVGAGAAAAEDSAASVHRPATSEEA